MAKVSDTPKHCGLAPEIGINTKCLRREFATRQLLTLDVNSLPFLTRYVAWGALERRSVYSAPGACQHTGHDFLRRAVVQRARSRVQQRQDAIGQIQ